MKRLFYALPVLVMPLFSQSADALVISTSTNATSLANTLAGSGITVTSASLIGAPTQQGTFTDGLSSGLGIDTGVILTSGNATLAPGPNNSAGISASTGTGTNAQLNGLLPSGSTTNDQNQLSFSFTSNTGDLFFQYQFASEEYNEFVNSKYNDVFGFFVDGVNIALVPGTTTPVSINTINGGNPFTGVGPNSGYYVNNSQTTPLYNIQYDGFTKVLVASILGLAAGEHTINLAIADTEDTALDSAVFLKAGSFTDTKPNVPEPATLAMLGLGFAGFGAMRRKNKKG